MAGPEYTGVGDIIMYGVPGMMNGISSVEAKLPFPRDQLELVIITQEHPERLPASGPPGFPDDLACRQAELNGRPAGSKTLLPPNVHYEHVPPAPVACSLHEVERFVRDELENNLR